MFELEKETKAVLTIATEPSYERVGYVGQEMRRESITSAYLTGMVMSEKIGRNTLTVIEPGNSLIADLARYRAAGGKWKSKPKESHFFERCGSLGGFHLTMLDIACYNSDVDHVHFVGSDELLRSISLTRGLNRTGFALYQAENWTEMLFAIYRGVAQPLIVNPFEDYDKFAEDIENSETGAKVIYGDKFEELNYFHKAMGLVKFTAREQIPEILDKHFAGDL
jgi:hypothetical protein